MPHLLLLLLDVVKLLLTMNLNFSKRLPPLILLLFGCSLFKFEISRSLWASGIDFRCIPSLEPVATRMSCQGLRDLNNGFTLFGFVRLEPTPLLSTSWNDALTVLLKELKVVIKESIAIVQIWF